MKGGYVILDLISLGIYDLTPKMITLNSNRELFLRFNEVINTNKPVYIKNLKVYNDEISIYADVEGYATRIGNSLSINGGVNVKSTLNGYLNTYLYITPYYENGILIEVQISNFMRLD